MKKVFIIILGIVGLAGAAAGSWYVLNQSQPSTTAQALVVSQAAEQALEQGDLLRARMLYRQAQDQAKNVQQYNQLQQKIEELNMNILFSPLDSPESVIYEVKPNDALAKIARAYNTTIELIKRANNLTSDVIRPGDRLKINMRKFSIAVDKSQNLLFLKDGDDVFKTYKISTGKDNKTPEGTFTIINKLEDPTWFRAGAVIPAGSPENILGPRWMGFDKRGYGIHGTNDPDSLGLQVTQGCIRLRNDEVVELYDVVPVGTEVVIVN